MIEIYLNEIPIQVGQDEDFLINENNTDGELCKAGKLLCFYGNLAVDLKTQLASAKLELESLEAEIAQEIRQESKLTGIKITEGGIQEKIIIHNKRKNLLLKIIQYEKDYLKVENLFRSQQKRVDCLIALAYKQRTEISKSY